MDAKILSTPQELVLIDQVYQNQRVGHRLKSIKPHTADKDDPKLRAACVEMESLFISHLFKEMRATVEKSDFIDGGQAEEIFTSLLDVEMSKKMSTAGGIGLSAILLEQLGAKATKKNTLSSQRIEDDIGMKP
jgi:Rod binding domain-containing protein